MLGHVYKTLIQLLCAIVTFIICSDIFFIFLCIDHIFWQMFRMDFYLSCHSSLPLLLIKVYCLLLFCLLTSWKDFSTIMFAKIFYGFFTSRITVVVSRLYCRCIFFFLRGISGAFFICYDYFCYITNN